MNCYLKFCRSYRLHPFPCTAEQAGLFASFLSTIMAPSSVSNYLSTLWAHQRTQGFEAYSSDYILRLILRGIKRLQSSSRKPRHPLSKQELLMIHQEINTLLPLDLTFWAITTLAFRALLRKAHYTSSVHNLRWCDLSIYPDHLVLTLPSSKTDQFGTNPLKVVLNASPGSPLCPHFWLLELSRVHLPSETDFIFRVPAPGGLFPVNYRWYNDRLKSLATAIGLDPASVSSHSLRHGGASFMSSLGSDMIDIRARGAWASSAVFTYLHHTTDSLRRKDELISSNLF